MVFLCGCLDKGVMHGYEMFKHRVTEIPIRRGTGRVGAEDQEGTVQVTLYFMAVYGFPAVRQRCLVIFAGIMVVLARTELSGVNSDSLSAVLFRLPRKDGDEQGRGTVIQRFAKALLLFALTDCLFLPVLIFHNGRFFLPFCWFPGAFLQCRVCHILYQETIPVIDQQLIGLVVMGAFGGR